ncbi:phage tail tape measure protein [uncultured Xylophilus sp.]|uniref:phage tail tape measure protein n=1 Tax=uncultured Xylophilus sp. TaxID=296832 RepID=UPI0025DC43D4|nr:phage tail tape measure protein [uncultured Xylophilus sp.]
MANDLRLQVVLQTIDKASAVLRKINATGGEAGKALKETRDRLKELDRAQADMRGFRTTTVQLRTQGRTLQELQEKGVRFAAQLEEQRTRHINIKASLKVAQQAHKELTERYQDGKIESAAYTRQLELARISLLSNQSAYERSAAALSKFKAQVKNVGDRTAQVGAQMRAGEDRLAGYRRRLEEAGIGTDGLAGKTRAYRASAEQLNATLKLQEAQLKGVADKQRALADLKARHAKAMLHTGMAAGTGVALKATGEAGVRTVLGPVRSYMAHQDAMLGVARQVEGARELGQLTPVYRAIEEQVRSLSHELPIPTTQIAEMVTAAARMEVPRQELQNFARTAAMMATAFDAVPDHVAESMGKVAKNFKIPVTEIAGLADSINYLDDNAISKGSDIIDFLNRTSGVVSTVAMSARDAAAIGSTLLTLGERTETASTATNAIVQKFAAATKGSKKFQAALGEIGLKGKDVQKGMSVDAVGTLDKVIAAIGKLPKDKRIGVMVELAGLEHSDTLAKLVDKPEELQRQRDLANGDKAKGAMAREFEARMQNMSAQLQTTQNRAFNLGAVLGERLEPALARISAVVNPLLEHFTRFVQNNPALVSGVLTLALAASALVAAFGMLLIPLALVVGKMMLARFVFAYFSGPVLATVAGGFAKLVGVFSWVARGAGLMWSAFVAGGPVVWAITAVIVALAAAAYLIYRNWGPIAAFFQQLWTTVRGAFDSALAWLVQLPMRFYNAGAEIMNGLANGITGTLGKVKDAIVGAAGAALGWFKEKLGIQSPSRVFMAAGQYIGEGAAIGIDNRQAQVRRAAAALAASAMVAMPGAAMAGDALGVDARPPLTAGPRTAQAAAAGGDTITINITAAPGMDAQAIARAISAELDRRQRERGAAARSRLSDID